MEKARRTTPHTILRGKRVLLRGSKESDKQDRLSAGRHPEFSRMVGEDPGSVLPITPEYVGRWYKRVSEDPLYWIIEVDGRCIGVAKLHSLEEANRRVRYATAIFDPSDWGHGYGTETTQLVLEYAFNELSLHRVDLRVLSSNKRAIACYEKCGFVREGIERETVLLSGEWDSDVLMSILEDEYITITTDPDGSS